MIIGHSHLVKDFKKLVKNNHLAHGYIFFGEPEVGKFYFAEHFANFLETGEFELSKKPLQDSLLLEDATGIDAMRELKNFLWQKPVISSRRLVVIDNAGDLTTQAQNAILKITEEPPERATLILVVHQPETLISPLQSRLQKIHFGRLADSEMEKVTSNMKAVSSAYGRPGRAMRLVSDELTEEAVGYADKFLKLPGPGRSKLIKDLIDQEKKIPGLLDLFFEELVISLRAEPVKNKDVLKGVLHRLFLIKSYNTNKRLQLEAIQ